MAIRYTVLKDLGPQERYVAVLDILGFRRIVHEHDTTALVDLLSHLQDMTTVATGFLAEREAGKRIRVHRVQYSDSYLLYTDDIGPIHLDLMVRSVASVISALMLWGVLVRGAIVRGDLFVSGNRQIFAGKALVRAHDLERQLDWAGAILDVDTIASDDEKRVIERVELREGWLMDCEVPWKNGRARGLAVGWPFWVQGGDISHYQEEVQNLLPDPDPEQQQKQNNTWAFFEEHRRTYPKSPLATLAELTPEAQERFNQLKEFFSGQSAEERRQAETQGISMLDFMSDRLKERLSARESEDDD
ncbi:MAG TPA: hypothetical protein VM327_02870 [Candidatus Thermoplasmatota archaeon]|nr:hypothetical protein [Candidatus Thermoplasmatota archaeon]